MATIIKIRKDYAVQPATDFLTERTIKKHFPHFKPEGVWVGYSLIASKVGNSMDVFFVPSFDEYGNPTDYKEQNASVKKAGSRYHVVKY